MPDYKIEENLIKQGYKKICGIDEVGRGSWAGPVVVCASFYNTKNFIEGINDSKKINEKNRDKLCLLLKKKSIKYAIGSATNKEIDAHGIMKSLTIASERALKKLKDKPDAIILDGNINYIKKEYNVFTYKKADEKSITVASSSILAKVYRDNLMKKVHNKENLKYSFHKNKGYGTKDHKEKIDKHGLSKHHRKTYNIQNSWETNQAK